MRVGTARAFTRYCDRCATNSAAPRETETLVSPLSRLLTAITARWSRIRHAVAAPPARMGHQSS